jgi:hypothetical protein
VIRDRNFLLGALGFRFGVSGPHAARTMMLTELRLLFERLSPEATTADYIKAVVADNVLMKPTKVARELTLRHLSSLYGLNVANPLFRALRRLWIVDESVQPMLALCVALARDPLLSGTQELIQNKSVGSFVAREDFEAIIAQSNPNRFSPVSLKSFAQNVSGTWSAAGYLVGRFKKIRTKPIIGPANITFCLFLGYLEGLTGQRLFVSKWINLLGISPQEVEALTNIAANRGYLVYLHAGGVKEVRFPDYLSASEEKILMELTHVV